MKARLLTAVIGIPAILLLLFLGTKFPFIIDIVLSLASAMCVAEVIHTGGMLKKYYISIPSILFGLSIPYVIMSGFLAEVIFVYFILMFACMIFFHQKVNFSNACISFCFTLIISFGLSSLIPLFMNDRKLTVYYFVVGLASTWLADSGALFAGMLFGKHKLCPTISPKKTVEGAIGGVICCTLFMLITGLIFDKAVFPNCEISANVNYINLSIVSFVCAGVSIIGDLTFSLIKRNYNAKDYGNIFPGHGGFLDRLDGVIFTFPTLYILSEYLPLVK
ncbi:MAG: phosphatidate cytidylyltransferase [Clostridia bacterium]|nr:phosphatidate cytidylyltransferase [Clostridia bacterium]